MIDELQFENKNMKDALQVCDFRSQSYKKIMDIEDSVSVSSIGGENLQLKLDIREIDNDLKALGGITSLVPTPKDKLSFHEQSLQIHRTMLEHDYGSQRRTTHKRKNRNNQI